MLPILSRASFPEISDIDREFGRLLRRVWGDGGVDGGAIGATTYPVNITEDDDAIYVEAEMPGFRSDEIDVTIEQGVLAISAERKEETTDKKEGSMLLNERRYTRYRRSFALPTPVDEEAVSAKMSDGVLHLTLPKRAEVKPRRIKVS